MSEEPRPAKILLIEDHLPDVLLVEEALRAQSVEFDLSHCADGEEALDHLASINLDGNPDLIILDLNLPRVTGFAILRAIRQQPRFDGVPVAILTSSGSPADRKRALQAGADAFIVKPPDLHEFRSGVGRNLAAMLSQSRGETAGGAAVLINRVRVAQPRGRRSGLRSRPALRARRAQA